MDNAAFDGLARRIANRRGLLRTIAGALATPAAGLAGTAATATAARCRTAGSSCGSGEVCCAGMRCKKRQCICNAGTGVCDASGRCVDLLGSNRNCGRCGKACSANQQCTGGLCCDKGASACNGRCCPAGRTCVAAHDDVAAVCCPVSQVFVACPRDQIVVDPATQSSYCNASAAEMSSWEHICCPAASVCPGDGLCCIDPDTQDRIECDANGNCPLLPVAAATYTPPVKGR